MHAGAQVAVLDHTASALGGAQLVVSRMVALLSQNYDVELIHNGGAGYLATLTSAFSANLERIREKRISAMRTSFSLPGAASLLRPERLDGIGANRWYDLFVYSGHGVPPRSCGKKGIIYCHFPFESAPVNARDKAGNPKLRGPVPWIKNAAYRWDWKSRMAGYQKIFANSHFTAEWIDRRWQMPAEVLYPPVDPVPSTRGKKNLIVTLGRFTGGPRSKNQLAQVQAFRDFCGSAREPWTLRIIGSCGESLTDREYLDRLRNSIDGLPIELLVNVERSVTVQSLAEARLFWHTAGLGVDEKERPEYAEHFGIAVVEAMRAGCVPVAVNSGGLREIIEHDKNGFLIFDLKSMAQTSAKLADCEEKLALMGDAARRRSAIFDGERFDRRFRAAVSECLAS